jgi:hypothetical protein
VRSTNHEAPHYEVFSTPLLPSPSYVQILSSTPCSQTPSAYPPQWQRPSCTPILFIYNLC